MSKQNLLVELFVEELPPKALRKLGIAFADQVYHSLVEQDLVAVDPDATPGLPQPWAWFASPRRMAVLVRGVLAQAADKATSHKLMPVSVGLDASGQPTPALLKKLQSLGAGAHAVAKLRRAMDGKAEALFHDSQARGATLAEGLQKALLESIAKLPIPKVMSYQLPDGWTSVHFVRPVHRLLALYGAQVVPVAVLGLSSDRITEGHRFESSARELTIRDADSYESQLQEQGAVIAGFDARRAEIARQLAAAASAVGGGVRPVEDDALLDEVTALVERPNVLVCEFEKQFLEVPQECLILTMKANQKYFPLLDTQGRLTNRFLVVSNIRPADASAVIGGNERVVRPRLADAKFFFNQDRKKTLASRVAELAKVVYHNKLGTQLERMQRVQKIAQSIAQRLDASLESPVRAAVECAKADLLTDMVGEFPELQGIMGRYYALNDGLPVEVADAIEDHYKPRFAGDALPRGPVGVVVALADKLETLAGMFGIGNLPTGDRDPFALRRHALGLVRMLGERDLPLGLDELTRAAFDAFGAGFAPFEGKEDERRAQLLQFIDDRLAGALREQGYSALEVEAVLTLRPQRLGDVTRRLEAVRVFAGLPEAPALAAANKRIGNILKKAGEVDARVSEALFTESAERKLFTAMNQFAAQANAQFDSGDYTASLRTLAALREPVDAFFDGVMVNAEQADVRQNRQGLLKSLHNAMNRVADLSRLAA